MTEKSNVRKLRETDPRQASALEALAAIINSRHELRLLLDSFANAASETVRALAELPADMKSTDTRFLIETLSVECDLARTLHRTMLDNDSQKIGR